MAARKHMRAERIKYPMGAVTAEGALIYDENVSGKRPAVLVAPNWLGMTDKAVQRGEFVAGNRYVQGGLCDHDRASKNAQFNR